VEPPHFGAKRVSVWFLSAKIEKITGKEKWNKMQIILKKCVILTENIIKRNGKRI
jgi:hypothetical protein